MLGIMAGMDQNDSGALIVDSCTDLCKARFAGFTARLLFPVVVGRPAGRSVWSRSTIVQFAGYTGDDAPRAVLLFFVVRPKMLGIMASMTQKYSCLEEYRKIGFFFWEMTSHVSVFSSFVRQWIHVYVTLQRLGRWFRLQKTAENPQLQFIDGRRFSCRGAQADSHGPAVQQTMVSPQLQFLYEVIDDPGMQLVQVRRCVQRQVPSTAAVHQQGRHLPFRGAEADSHGLTVQADDRDSPSAFYTVVDVPVAWPCRLSCVAVEKTAAIPQLHLSCSCLDKVVHTPVVCNDICLVVQSAENCDG